MSEILLPPLADAFADQCRYWGRKLGAGDSAVKVLGQAAALVAGAASQGHVCLDACDWPKGCTAADLLASKVVTLAQDTPDLLTMTPLVLDSQNRLYLRYYYDQEQNLAKNLFGLAASSGLTQPLQANPLVVSEQSLRLLDELFPKASEQKEAVRQALQRRLSVISGGPGTGKTTTVARLLACLLVEQNHLRIQLAAPTGKAAARMMESLGQRANELPAAVRAALPQEASTVHRLLGIHPQRATPRHHRDNPLPLDVLVVDEASMLDLALANQLLDAVSPHARLILLGDKDQLAAVEAGAVFSEISSQVAQVASTNSANNNNPLAACVSRLTQSHRFGLRSKLGQLATSIVQGDVQTAFGLLLMPAEAAETVLWQEDEEGLSHAAELRLQAAWQPYIAAVLNFSNDPSPIFAALDNYRVLCARRSGLRGVEHINKQLEHALRPRLSQTQLTQQSSQLGSQVSSYRSPHFLGRPVLITKNDPLTQRFNGDIGVILPPPAELDLGGLAVCFPHGKNEFRWLPLARLPAHESAFALTIHKSQGSEFSAVSVILPASDSPLLTRELIYTAVTRARRTVEIFGGVNLMGRCIERRTRRHNGLGARLQELAVVVSAPNAPMA